MKLDDKTKDENLQNDISRKAEKASVLSSGKTDKYEILRAKKNLRLCYLIKE